MYKYYHTCCLEQPPTYRRAHRWHNTAEKRLLQRGAFGTLRGNFRLPDNLQVEGLISPFGWDLRFYPLPDACSKYAHYCPYRFRCAGWYHRMREGAQPGCKYSLPKTCLDSIPIYRARQRRSLGCWKYNIPDEFNAIPRRPVRSHLLLVLLLV